VVEIAEQVHGRLPALHHGTTVEDPPVDLFHVEEGAVEVEAAKVRNGFVNILNLYNNTMFCF